MFTAKNVGLLLFATKIAVVVVYANKVKMYLEMNGCTGYPVFIHIPVQIIFDVLEEKIFVVHHIEPP